MKDCITEQMCMIFTYRGIRCSHFPLINGRNSHRLSTCTVPRSVPCRKMFLSSL